MKNSQNGFAVIPIVIFLALLLIGGGAYLYVHNKQGNQTTQPISTTQTPKDVRQKDTERVIDMDKAMKALVSYYTKNKSCPDSLSNLIPAFIDSLPILPNQGENYSYAFSQDKLNCHLGVILESIDPSLFYETGLTGTSPWRGCNSSINNGCFSSAAINGFDGTNPKIYNKVILKEKYGALFVSKQNSDTFSAIMTGSGFTNIKMDRGVFQSISPSNLSDSIKKGILYTTDTTDFLQFNSSRPRVESDYLPLDKVKIDGYFDRTEGNGIITRVEQL